MLTDKWEITIDPSSCRGSGLCAAFSPEAFELGPNNKSRPRSNPVTADPTVIDAASCCPTEAIAVTDVATGALVFPEG
jgi:ferredoxin